MSDFDTQNMTNIHEQIMPDATTWRLYGTVGCHLCEIAESLLLQAQAVADIRWQSIDIAELPEQEMLEFADKIPVLVTATKTLYYPFSIMDIMALSWKANIDYWHNIKNLIHYVLADFFYNQLPNAYCPLFASQSDKSQPNNPYAYYFKSIASPFAKDTPWKT